MNALLTLDHLVYGVPDLAKAIDDFGQRLGLSPICGGRHEGLGTHNAILPLAGETYLELIASDPEGPIPNQPRPFGLDRLDHPRLVTWAARSRDIETDVERARGRNYDPGIVFAMTREEPDGDTIRWKLAIRAEPFGDGLVPFVIDWGDTRHPSESIYRSSKRRQHQVIEKDPRPESESRCALSEFSATHPEPDSIRAAINALGLDFEIQRGPEPSLHARLTGPAGSVELRGPAK